MITIRKLLARFAHRAPTACCHEGAALMLVRLERQAEAMLSELQHLKTRLVGIDQWGEPAGA